MNDPILVEAVEKPPCGDLKPFTSASAAESGADERMLLLTPLPSCRALFPRPRHARPGAVLVALAWVFSIALIIAGAFAGYWAERRQDQYQLIQLGQRIYDGGRIYADCWENKPPGIAWINALGLALGRGDQLGPWVLPPEVALGALAITFIVMRRRFGTFPAVVMLVIGAGVYSLRAFDTPCINPDFYASMFELGAFSVCVAGVSARRASRAILACIVAGLLFAVAGAIKQTTLVSLIALSLPVLAAMPLAGTRRRRWIACGLSVWTGFAAGVACVIAVLWAQGTLELARHAVFGFNAGLLSWTGLIEAANQSLLPWSDLTPLQLPLWLALLGLLATVRSGPAHRGRSVLAIGLLAWWISQVVLARMGPSHAMRYWQATFPAMLWLGALGAAHLRVIWTQLPSRSRAVFATICITSAVFLGGPLVSWWKTGAAQAYVAATSPRSDRERLRDIAQHINDVVPPGAIYVWGYDPGIYLYSRRTPAARFNYPRDESQMSEILATLAGGSSVAVLVANWGADAFDHCCGRDWRGERDAVFSRYVSRGEAGGYQIRVWSPGASQPSPATSPE